MQFSAITMILVAATAANALPEPLRFPGMPKPRPNKPNKPNKPNNGADSSWKWDAASLAISVADFGTTLSTTFAGNSGMCGRIPPPHSFLISTGQSNPKYLN